MMTETNWSNDFIEEYKCREFAIYIRENFEPTSECCIYKVPKMLREVNEKAYTPQLISIGPIHYREKELADMEKQKVRYKREFGKRISKEKWEDLIYFVKSSEQSIRNCYAETFKLGSLEFVTMILYDAIFIIELFLRYYHGDESDWLVTQQLVNTFIWLDLQLLENQLPYFLLEELYMLAFPQSCYDGGRYPSFLFLSFTFFQDEMFRTMPQDRNVKHFIDLRRNALLNTCLQAEPDGVEDLPNATKLSKSGVKFKLSKEECLLNIRTVKRNQRIPFLDVVELQIPLITVKKRTECLFRNMMALEQCHYPNQTHVCHYIKVLDYLIDTEKDVDLLVEEGIISYDIGDHVATAKLFNKLNNNIFVGPRNDIGKDLKDHSKNWWNHAKANLISVYFNNPWRTTGTLAAAALLVFTFIQVICSILQVVHEKKK